MIKNPTYTFSQKWGDDPFTKMGHAQIPSALLAYGARLGIDPTEGYLICHILDYKWTPGDAGPNQNELAARFGRSVDRVHALLASLEKKKFLKITYTRGDFGKFTNALYDFRHLRACLNECYYQDHPEERPIGKKPFMLPTVTKTVPQLRGAAKRSRESAENQSADPRSGSPRKRGVGVRGSAETPIDALDIKEEKEVFSASLFPEEVSEEVQDVLDALLPEQWTELEAKARTQVIESSVDPVRKLAREGKAWTSVKPMMRKIWTEQKDRQKRAEQK